METRLNMAIIDQTMNAQDLAQVPSCLNCISRAQSEGEQPPIKIHRRTWFILPIHSSRYMERQPAVRFKVQVETVFTDW